MKDGISYNRSRFGIIVPWVNTAVEDELPQLVQGRAGLHFSRIKPRALPSKFDDETYMADMLRTLPNAANLFEGLELKAIILACTSATFEQFLRCEGIEQGITTAFECVVKRLRTIGASSITLHTPYSRALMKLEADTLRSQGIAVLKECSIAVKGEFRNVGKQALVDSLKSSRKTAADAALISCTGLHTIEVISQRAEDSIIGIPIVSSVSSIAAHIQSLTETLEP